jgi:hypothetical protein
MATGWRFRIVDMCRRRFVLLLAMMAPSLGTSAEPLPDFSGTWQVVEAQNSTPHAGFDPSRRRGFTFVIEQDRTELRVVFPKLPALIFELDGSDNRYVHDSGDAWTRFKTVARWDGAILTLKSTTFNGWWKTSDPSRVDSQATELEETRTLRFEMPGGKLRMETSSRDEKPFLVQYVDVLVKVQT